MAQNKVQKTAQKAVADAQQAVAGVQQAATQTVAGVQQAATQAATQTVAGVQQAATQTVANAAQNVSINLSDTGSAPAPSNANAAPPANTAPAANAVPAANAAPPTIPSTLTKQVTVNDPEAAQKAIQTSQDGLQFIGIMLFCLYVMKGLLHVFQKEQEALHRQFDLYVPPAEDAEGEEESGNPRMVPYQLSRMASIPYQAILHSYTQLVFVIGIFFVSHTFFYSDKHGLLAAFYKPAIYMLRFAFLFFLVTMALNLLIRIRSAVLRMDPVTPFQRSKMVQEQKGIFMTICVGMVMMLIMVLRSNNDV